MATTTWPWRIHLDRMICLTGVYGAPNTTWHIGIVDETLNVIVLSDDFGADAGKVLTPLTNDGYILTVAGDYSAGPAMIGRLFEMSIELTELFYRGRDGTIDLNALLIIRNILAKHKQSGPYTIKVTATGRADRERSFTIDDEDLSEYDEMIAWFGGLSDQVRIFLTSTNPKPVTISSMQFLVDVIRGK